MLRGIEFKNYKAFRQGHLEIKPITILLGANSVGKSSIIQLFLMLQETASAEQYKSALKLNGGFLSLGEGINLFHKKDTKNELGISIELCDSDIFQFLTKRLIAQFSNAIDSSTYYFISYLSRRGEKQYQKLSNLLSIGDVVEKINQAHSIVSSYNRKEIDSALKADLPFIASSKSIITSLINSSEELISTYNFLSNSSRFKKADTIKIEYDFCYTDGVLSVKTMILTIGDIEEIIFDFSCISHPDNFIKFKNNLLSKSESKNLAQINKLFNTSRTIFSIIGENRDPIDNKYVFNEYFLRVIEFCLNIAKDTFHTKKINYVSPLRAYPKRYYFLDKAKTNLFLDTLDGEAIAEILKENNYLKQKVNTWFKRFNIHIDVEHLKDIIHQIVVKQENLNLDLTDVGFGISQVLPVIIQGFLSRNGSLTLIEQPEIHLHPKMQADLADLFIDIAFDRTRNTISKYLIIETHSEYLLKRLRRRMSDYTASKGKQGISSENVAIYYVESQSNEQGAIIRKIDIDKKGAFDWPLDFYSGDLADDITEFLKNQM